MNAAPDAWRHKHLIDCCLTNFQWVFDLCMGDYYNINDQLAPLAICTEPLPQASGKWYVESYTETDPVCVKECNGPAPCNGRAVSYQELYETFSVCCQLHLWWKLDCAAYDENGNGGEGILEPSNKYFVDYQTGSCLQDCEPGPFGCALVPPPIVLYDTIEVCCAIGQWWVDFDYCTSRSIDDYSDGWIVDYTNQKCCES